MNNIIDILKKLNFKAKINGDIPVSAIIIKDNKIIAKAYNQKFKNNNPLDHAEILAIKKACKKLNTTNLIDCEMYVTLKPCEMCANVINECRLKKVYYFADITKHVNNTIKYTKINDQSLYFSEEISDFFKNKR